MNREPIMIVRLLRVVAIVCLLGGGASERVSAQVTPSPEAVAAANELFAILSVDLMKQLTAQMTNLMWPMVEQKARAEKIDDGTIAELRQEFDRVQSTSMTDIMKEAPPIYARHFSVDELHQLTAFYQTPIGAKALRELPQVMGEFVTVIGPRMQNMQQQAGAGFDQILRQHGYIK
jgi:hypothetical protein